MMAIIACEHICQHLKLNFVVANNCTFIIFLQINNKLHNLTLFFAKFFTQVINFCKQFCPSFNIGALSISVWIGTTLYANITHDYSTQSVNAKSVRNA